MFTYNPRKTRGTFRGFTTSTYVAEEVSKLAERELIDYRHVMREALTLWLIFHQEPLIDQDQVEVDYTRVIKRAVRLNPPSVQSVKIKPATTEKGEDLV